MERYWLEGAGNKQARNLIRNNFIYWLVSSQVVVVNGIVGKFQHPMMIPIAVMWDNVNCRHTITY